MDKVWMYIQYLYSTVCFSLRGIRNTKCACRGTYSTSVLSDKYIYTCTYIATQTTILEYIYSEKEFLEHVYRDISKSLKR